MKSGSEGRRLKVKLLANTMLISLALHGTGWTNETGWGFLENRQALEKRIAASSGDERARAQMNLAALYVERGFYREAYAIAARVAESEPHAFPRQEDRELARLAFVLSGLPETEDKANTRNMSFVDPGKDKFWHLAHAAFSGEKIPGEIDAEEALSSLKVLAGYPEGIQRKVALALINAAFEAGDRAFARALISHLPAAALASLPEDCRVWTSGRLAELENYPRTALDRYAQIRLTGSECAAMATYRRTALGLNKGALPPGRALDALETLLRDWKGGPVERDALALASDVARSLGQKDKALDYLQMLWARFPSSFEKDEIREKASRLALERLTPQGGGNPEALKAERAAFRHFISTEPELVEADMAFARNMSLAGRYRDAQETYEDLLKRVPGDTGADTLSLRRAICAALAQTWVKLGELGKARNTLSSVPGEKDPASWEGPLREAYLDVAIARKDVDTARKTLGAAISPDERRRLADASLHGGMVQPAFELMSELFETEEVITAEDSDRLATAALLSGHGDEANLILAPHRNIWGGQAKIAAIAFTDAPEMEEDGSSPDTQMTAILDASDELIAIASELAAAR